MTAREAFVHGWALSDGPMTDAVQAAYLVACQHPDHLAEAAALGHMAGTWALIAARRDQLHTEHATHIVDAWRKLARRIDLHTLIRQIRADLGLVEAVDPATHADVSRNAKPAVYMLADPAQQEWQAFTAALAAGMSAAAAEGVAAAVAAAAAQAGVTGVDVQAAYDTAVAAQTATDTAALEQAARQTAQQIVRAATNDLTRTLSKAASDSASAMQMLDAARNVLGITGDAANIAANLLTDQALAQQFMHSMGDWMLDQGVTQVDFVTDPASNVCPICRGYEDQNPWSWADVPEPEIHPRCRCSLLPAQDADLSAIDFGPYIDTTRTSLDQWGADEVNAVLAAEHSDVADSLLAAIWAVQRFDALPQVVSAAELDKLAGTVLYRGIAGDQAAAWADALRGGDYFAGLGTYGNGTYTATERMAAEGYARGRGWRGTNSDGVVVKMVLNPDANTITLNDLRTLMANDPAMQDPTFAKAFGDPGRYASARGYDAITVTTDPTDPHFYMVVLNRAALTIQDTNLPVGT